MTRLVLVIAIVMCAPQVVDAQAPTKDPADIAFDEGGRLYDLREWDQAIAKFKEAYRLRPEARSLFNIAQSYRLAGNCAEAYSFYKTYRRNYPTAPNIDKVDKFIAELEDCAKQQPAKPEPPQPNPPAPTGAAAGSPIPRSPPEPRPGKAGAVAFGAGALVLAGGAIGLELWARSTYDSAKAETADQAHRDSLYSSANTKRYFADGFAVGSVACAGVALFLLVHRHEEPARSATSRIIVSPTGVAVTGRF